MYRKGENKDKDDLLDFINYVFSYDHEPTDFQRLLPKVYGENCHMEDIHHMIVEDDRIKAVIGIYPGVLQVGENKLRTAYIGSVSVHPYARGMGYMKVLMKKVQEEIAAQGYDLAALSGQRQRYEHFGYFRGGQVIQYQVSETNLRHYFMGVDNSEGLADEMELNLVEQKHNDDTYMEAIFKIYQNRIMTGRERDKFYASSVSYGAELYAVTMHGVCIGYYIMDPMQDYITEFELIDMQLLPYILRMVLEDMDIDVLGIKTGILDKDKNLLLTRICERYTMGQAQMYHILNYEKVFQTLLHAKTVAGHLCDGEFHIGVEEEDRVYALRIENNVATVNVSDEAADVVMSEEEIIRILISTDYQNAVIYDEIPGLHLAPAGWFPLPLCFQEADTF